MLDLVYCHYSHAIMKLFCVLQYIGDVTPPVINSIITKQCTGYYLMESSCDGDYWMFNLEISDDYG